MMAAEMGTVGWLFREDIKFELQENARMLKLCGIKLLSRCHST